MHFRKTTEERLTARNAYKQVTKGVLNSFSHPSVPQSVRPSICPPIQLSVHLSNYPSINPSIHPSLRLSVRPSVRLLLFCGHVVEAAVSAGGLRLLFPWPHQATLTAGSPGLLRTVSMCNTYCVVLVTSVGGMKWNKCFVSLSTQKKNLPQLYIIQAS